MNRKKFIAWILIIIIVGTSIYGVKWLFFSNQTVVVSFNKLPDSHVTIHKAYPEDLHEPLEAKLGDRVQELQSGQEITLRQGSYIIDVKGKNIIETRYALDVGDEPVDKELEINFSTSYLDTLLREQEPAIHTALKQQLPQLEGLYMIKAGKLYLDGNWYATRLRYLGENDAQRDTLKLVMQRQSSGQWELVTKPPRIILGFDEFKQVPQSILKDINANEEIQSTPIGE